MVLGLLGRSLRAWQALQALVHGQHQMHLLLNMCASL